MSICHSGMSSQIIGKSIAIAIDDKHPLIKLANALPWTEVADIVMLDLKKTTAKQQWWTGRALRLRIHLGIYFLQQRFSTFTFEALKVDLKAIKKLARVCYFTKSIDKAEKNNHLSDLWCYVFSK